MKFIWTAIILLLMGCQSYYVKDYQDVRNEWNQVDKSNIENIELFEKNTLTEERKRNLYNYVGWSFKDLLKEINKTKDEINWKNALLMEWEDLQKTKFKFSDEELKKKYEILKNDRLKTYQMTDYAKNLKLNAKNLLKINFTDCGQYEFETSCVEKFNLFNAYQNEKEFPNIYNNLKVRVDEFEFRDLKQEYNLIRNKKNALILARTNKNLNVSDYDFKRKGYYVQFEQYYNYGVLFFPFPVLIFKSDKKFIPVPEASAKEWMNNLSDHFIIHVQLKPSIKSVNYIRFQEPGKSSYDLPLEKLEDIESKGYSYYAKKVSSPFRVYDLVIMNIEFL